MLSINANIIYTIINVLILFAVFKIFLFKRIDKVLDARKQEIETATKEAEEKSAAADLSKAEYESNLSKLNDEREALLTESKEKGYKEYSKIVANAKIEADSILDDAVKDAASEKKRQKKIYESELTEMVVSAASKISAASHSEESDRELYNRFINEAEDKPDNED